MAYLGLFISQTIADFGYALYDIVTELSLLLLEIDLPEKVNAFLMDRLSNIEYRLSHGISEKLQLGALVGAFTIARTMMTIKAN